MWVTPPLFLLYVFSGEDQAEDLIRIDLTRLLNKKNFKRANFEIESKTKAISLRLSSSLLLALKQTAKKRGISYQKLIRKAVKESIKKKSGINNIPRLAATVFKP
ncbi:MAG: CopG family transcriptional regulator [Deltaproteobacteria bacterium]|nr:CopG family transcriptional regulator [Deltaproteobacteria bacterium]